MYRTPVKENMQWCSDHEQASQAYEQGYESRRLNKSYVNPWKRSIQQYNPAGYVINNQLGWEDDLNMWFYNGYYDWQPTDWVPYLSEDKQNDYAINPKTGLSRKPVFPTTGIPKDAWNNTVINLNPIVAA